MEINYVCLFEPSWGSSLERSRGFFGASWAVLEAILGILDAMESARDVSGRRQSLGKRGRFARLGAAREGGGPLEDYRNLARQHWAFFHASTCQGARWRIAVL